MNNGNVNNNNRTNASYVRPVAVVPSSATPHPVYDIPFLSIVEAWIDCERNKKQSNSCVKFRWHAARDLVKLWEQMREGKYVPLASMVFVVTYPVLREVWAGAFRDRVAHHWEALRFGPVLESYIVDAGNNSMNCRKGFGSLRAVNTFGQMLYEFTEGYSRTDCYIVGGDFANYFMSIDKNLLWTLLEQVIGEEYQGRDKLALLYMMRRTLFHRCQDNYYRRSDLFMWEGLPPRKSLFTMDGLPIGNLPSQLWANFLGAVFMSWMMHKMGCKEFLLFVDDWRVLVRSAEVGRCLIKETAKFLSDTLHVTLHPDKVYLQHYTKGTKMIGVVVKPKRVYISNRTRGHFVEKMRKFKVRAQEANEAGRVSMLEELRQSVNSYLGLMCHYNSYKVRRRICMEEILPTWGKYIFFVDEFKKCVIRKEYNEQYLLKKRLRKGDFARKFVRPKYQGAGQ